MYAHHLLTRLLFIGIKAEDDWEVTLRINWRYKPVDVVDSPRIDFMQNIKTLLDV